MFYPLSFRKSIKTNHVIDSNISTEKLHCNTNRETAKLSALSSSKIYEYVYRTGEEILPSNQSQMIEHDRFRYWPSGKVLENQTKKQVDALKSLKPFW